jgi:hypothetical protein
MPAAACRVTQAKGKPADWQTLIPAPRDSFPATKAYDMIMQQYFPFHFLPALDFQLPNHFFNPFPNSKFIS